MPYNDKRSPDYWRNIRPGQSINLSDEWTIKKGQERGAGVRGLAYTIEKVRRIDEIRNLATWIMLDLRAPEEIMWLWIKIVDKDVTVRLMDESENPDGGEFPAGDRADQVNWKNFFLFQQPDDPDNIVYRKLSFTEAMEIGGEKYNWLGQEFHGKVTDAPVASGMTNLMASLVEYASENEKAEFRHMLLLEVGNPSNPNGGIINIYKGRDINPAIDVDVI